MSIFSRYPPWWRTGIIEVEYAYLVGINRKVDVENGAGFYLRCVADVDGRDWVEHLELAVLYCK
jgi:hypothetical protein